MRIGIACPYSFAAPGGVQNHVLGLAGWLAERGHHVDVLGPDGLPAAAPCGVGFTSCGRALAVHHNGSVARVAFGISTVRAADAWLRAGAFDVVHVHEPISPSASLIALARTTDPVVATFHSARPDTEWHELSRRVLGAVLDKIDVPVAVSPAAADLAELSLGRRPLVIPNGIDVDAFDAGRPASPWRGGIEPRIAFVGRDEPRKGLAVFLDAVPALRAAYPRADVVVASNTERPLPPGVRLLACPDDAARDALLASSDVYVAPNTGRESFGIVLLEALASGAAVVASDLPAFEATVDGDRAGVVRFFATGDPDALAGAVLDALRHPAEPTAARALAAVYDWDRVGPQVERAYTSARARGPIA